jgi:hypothetical protein
MGQTLDLVHLRRRILDYTDRRAKKLLPGLPALHPGAGRRLVEIYQAGQLGESEVPALLGQSERTAREIVMALLQEGFIASANQKAPLTIGFPSHVLGDYFPALCDKADTTLTSELSSVHSCQNWREVSPPTSV